MAIPSPISYAEFDKVDIRVGRIVRADEFPEAREPDGSSDRDTLFAKREEGEWRSFAG